MCPYSEFFWYVISRIRTKYQEMLRISPYSVRMWENMAQKNSKHEYSPHRDHLLLAEENASNTYIIWQAGKANYKRILEKSKTVLLTGSSDKEMRLWSKSMIIAFIPSATSIVLLYWLFFLFFILFLCHNLIFHRG